jgi:hypothetical protein
MTVMTIYTTTTPRQAGQNQPLGIIPVGSGLAGQMAQVAFSMDVRRIAFLPVDTQFFPRLAEPGHGIVHTASLSFHRLVQNTIAQVLKRPELIVKLGPDI